MSAAHQRKVVLQLRLPPPDGRDRWTPSLIARQAGLSILEANVAIRALRNSGKIKFGALELSASMRDADLHTNGDASATPGTEASMARTEATAVTAGEIRRENPSPLVGEGARDAEAERVGEGDLAVTSPTPPHPSAAAPLPPSPTRGEGDSEHESATAPSVHPGEHEVVAAAGDDGPLPSIPGHTDPVTSSDGGPDGVTDGAGAQAVVAPGAPASSNPDATLGQALLAEIELYLARTRMGASLLGDLALTHPGYVNLLRLRGTARPKTAEPMRAFMARWFNGTTRDEVAAWRREQAEAEAIAQREASTAAAPGRVSDPAAGFMSVADAVKAEALVLGDRRRSARRLSATVHDPLSPNVIAVQAALLAQPEDVFDFLRRKWPNLLRDTIALARAEEITPARMLARVIEAGLLCIADERKGEAA